MIGTSRCPCRSIDCRVGKICWYARSPVAPKMTRASPRDSAAAMTAPRRFVMAAKLQAQRREQAIRKIVFPSRAEPLEERRREHGGGGRAFNRGQRGPASFAGIRDASGKRLKV